MFLFSWPRRRVLRQLASLLWNLWDMDLFIGNQEQGKVAVLGSFGSISTPKRRRSSYASTYHRQSHALPAWVWSGRSSVPEKAGHRMPGLVGCFKSCHPLECLESETWSFPIWTRHIPWRLARFENIGDMIGVWEATTSWEVKTWKDTHFDAEDLKDLIDAASEQP